jgi:hypothetical protein
MLDAALELLALLDLGREFPVGRLQLPPRMPDSVPSAMEAVHEIVRGKCKQPGDRCEQQYGESQIARRIPSRFGTHSQLEVACGQVP